MRRSTIVVAAAAWALLSPATGGAAEAEAKLLWQIGKADDDTAEFALAPGGYRNYDRDGFFVVGRSKARRDWPYTHPGPVDSWAGSRAHTFTILFGLKASPKGACRLVVDLVNSHYARPPVLQIAVNAQRFQHATPKGGSDASITGNPKAGKEHRFAVDIPAEALKAGLNRIAIANATPPGSWLLYDWLALEAPPGTQLAPAEGALLQDMHAARWLTRKRGRLVQPVSVTLLCVGGGGEVSLHAEGAPPVKLARRLAPQSVELELPPAEAETQVTVALRRGGETLDARTVTVRPGRERQRIDYVDCLLGTGSSRWMLYPGPSMPFGMVKLSPDNQRRVWKAGYEYAIENIAGFSHLHSWTMGGLLTMPATGQLKTVPGAETDPDGGYRSRFSHDNETASPGYYAVTLDDYKVRAELTATTRAGFQRYTFPEAKHARILFDLEFPTEYGFRVLEGKVTRVSDREIAGYAKQRSTGWNEYTVHFVAEVDRPFKSMGGWVGEKVQRDVKSLAGRGDMGVFLEYATDEGDVVQLKTGISLVSVEQARLNLKTEMKPFGWDFSAAREHARKVWSELLGRIEVEGGTETDKVKFFTNLYRSYCARTIWSDVNGKYVDMYEKVQQLADADCGVYGCDAFWNTFWNLNQLWTLSTPDIANKWVKSLLEIYDRGGWLAKGPTGIEYSSIMVASHEIALIVSAYQKGIRGYDAEKAYRATKHIQTTPGRPHPGGGHVGNRQLKSYMELGYVPVERGPVSNTMEYAYDDWCVAQMARALGKDEDYQTFLKRSQNYRNVYDASVGYVRPKHRDGRWAEKFSPFGGRGYVEGNAWQYTWFVPHDVKGLIELMGGREKFCARLEEGFEKARPRFTSRYVNHGNQPNMQAAWLFNYAGKPWLTQKWTRAIMSTYYGTGPHNGYPGDEDQGQMGAWYAMSAIGLFEMDGGCATKPIYEIGSPIFDRVVIHLDKRYYPGGQFVIETKNNSAQNVYVQSAELNGKPLDRPWLYHQTLVGGGKLVLEMGPKPNKQWGSAPQAAPPQ